MRFTHPDSTKTVTATNSNTIKVLKGAGWKADEPKRAKPKTEEK